MKVMALRPSFSGEEQEEGDSTDVGGCGPMMPLSVRCMANAGGPMECRWSPYINNGGTVLAVAGDDYVVVIGDTRLSIGYAIHTRRSSKIAQLTSKCVIATAGMQSEMLTLHRLLKIRVDLYKHRHRTEPSVTAVAQMLSVILYSKRFFPYYTFNLLAGVDDEGKGAVYGYDAIGSCERGKYHSAGTGGTLMMSILDNRIGKSNQLIPSPNLSKVEVIDFVKDAMSSAAERDIFTGDQAEVCVVDAAGVSTSTMELRKD